MAHKVVIQGIRSAHLARRYTKKKVSKKDGLNSNKFLTVNSWLISEDDTKHSTKPPEEYALKDKGVPPIS